MLRNLATGIPREFLAQSMVIIEELCVRMACDHLAPVLVTTSPLPTYRSLSIQGSTKRGSCLAERELDRQE
jgi:hypothetical protein